MSIASRINEMTEHLRNDWNSINKLGLKTKKLPDEYRQVEYIESSGTQYIDTGFAPNQNTRTVIDFMPTYAGSLFIFGARLGYNNNAYDLYTFGPKFRDDYANTNYGGASSQPFPKSENKRYLFDKNKNHSIMYEENVQFYDNTFNEQAINLSFNMFLFGVDDNGSISSNMARMKLYSCKIYDDNTPIRDFVPCYRINDVKVGLYDTINDVFYTNQGAGAFTYGKIQEEIPNKNIKNIAPVLNRFYNQASDKTDLSENGIVGRTSQDGDPTPENPVEINNLSGGVEYKVRGKNLFDINNALNNNLYNQGTSLSLITNGIRTTTEAVSNYRMGLIKIGETNKLIGKTIRLKANFSSNGNNNGRFYIGYCDASGGNRVPKSDTTTSGDTLSMVVESGSGENICLALYSNNNGTNYTIGNYVDYKNIIMTVDNEDMTYEPYISESFPLSLKSRNLFDKDNVNVISAYISGSKIISSATVDKLIYIPCKPNTTYSLQKMSQETTNYNRFRIGTTTDIPALRMTVEDYFNAGDGSTLTNKTITTGANANYLVFYCYREDELTNFEDMLSSIQIEEGSTATTYEPYYDIELCDISDYKDRIYSQNGEFYLEKNTGKVVLDGSETWAYSVTNLVFYSDVIQTPQVVKNGTRFYCNRFNYVSWTTSYENMLNGQGKYQSNGHHRLILKNTAYTITDDFKQWLSTNNTNVYYVLVTTTTTEITQENYPTLYSQLLAIQEFLTKYKINKEFLLNYSSPEIEY